MNIITRFAPSPTGFLHLGNIRIALFSWLYTRKNNGKFFLRIDNTDIKRCKQKYIDNIFYILEWLGLYWDDNVFYQYNNLDLYKYYINILLKENLAYKCFCSIERLNKIRKICIKKRLKPKYDKYCRDKNFNYKNLPYVIRFKNPLFGNLIFKDEIFNSIVIKNKELDDFIIQKYNGDFTYNFCTVIDDYIMNITHIIRGSEHINNTPRQINIIKSLNLYKCKYIHLPILLDNNKKKLSKRDFLSNINYYINKGYLPETLISFLFKLGSSYTNIEILNNLNYLKNIFVLNKYNKSPCFINKNKLKWINKYYLNNINKNKLIFYLKPFFLKFNIIYIKNIYEIIYLIKERITILKDIVKFYLLINNDNIKWSLKIFKKYNLKFVFLLFKFLIKSIKKCNFWSILNIKTLLLKCIHLFKYKYIFKIIRYTLISNEIGIDVYILIYLFKKDKILLIFKKVLKYIKL